MNTNKNNLIIARLINLAASASTDEQINSNTTNKSNQQPIPEGFFRPTDKPLRKPNQKPVSKETLNKWFSTAFEQVLNKYIKPIATNCYKLIKDDNPYDAINQRVLTANANTIINILKQWFLPSNMTHFDPLTRLVIKVGDELDPSFNLTEAIKKYKEYYFTVYVKCINDLIDSNAEKYAQLIINEIKNQHRTNTNLFDFDTIDEDYAEFKVTPIIYINGNFFAASSSHQVKYKDLNKFNASRFMPIYQEMVNTYAKQQDHHQNDKIKHNPSTWAAGIDFDKMPIDLAFCLYSTDLDSIFISPIGNVDEQEKLKEKLVFSGSAINQSGAHINKNEFNTIESLVDKDNKSNLDIPVKVTPVIWLNKVLITSKTNETMSYREVLSNLFSNYNEFIYKKCSALVNEHKPMIEKAEQAREEIDRKNILSWGPSSAQVYRCALLINSEKINVCYVVNDVPANNISDNENDAAIMNEKLESYNYKVYTNVSIPHNYRQFNAAAKKQNKIATRILNQ